MGKGIKMETVIKKHTEVSIHKKILDCKFPTESVSEKNLKISQGLIKLLS